jgi:heterodisulfide reductase subunit B
MKTALFRCCVTSMGLEQYESSANAVLHSLGAEFVDIKEFNCCGYPLRNIDFRAFLISSARNLALAGRDGAKIVTFCSCCYGNLKYAAHILATNVSLRGEINATLGKEGLVCNGGVTVTHFLEMLYRDIGVEEIRSRLKKTFKGLKVAAHYGCHLLRPKKIVGADEMFAPSLLDALVSVTDAECVAWDSMDECCGAPLCGVNDELSMDLAQKKLKSARKGGADCLCVTCPYCQIQFDRNQKMLLEQRNSTEQLPSLLYAQLLGLCLGIDRKELGLDSNAITSTAEDYLQASSPARDATKQQS